MEAVFKRAQAETLDPNSPYYIYGPSSVELIDKYTNTIDTNYFGPNAKNYLARNNMDSFEMLDKMREKRTKRNWMYGIGIAAAAIGAYLFRGKIPFIGKFLKKV